jgi:membrane protease YdiL (CAAX protease family)
MKKSLLSIYAAALVPVLSFAQAPIARTIDGFLDYVLYLAGRALPLLILAALVLLLFGIVRTFFFNSDEGKRAEGKSFVLWGIIALFVMVSVWGLVNILRGSFLLDNDNVPLAPAIPVQNAPAAQPYSR